MRFLPRSWRSARRLDWYPAVKLLHVLSATILFGTGIGTAFFMLRAYLANDVAAFRETAQSVVLADTWFTTPAVAVQLATGLWLTARLGIPWTSHWFVLVVALFAVVGACWIPVVVIQVRVRNILRCGGTFATCRSLMRWWIGLGIPAFAAVLVLFLLMVYRPWIGAFATG